MQNDGSPLAGRGYYISVLTGGRFYLNDPSPRDVKIEDIAGALSKICRYLGHTEVFYSVAEHCVALSLALRDGGWGPLTQLHALLHDAHEAYTGDMPRPLKKVFPDVREWEHKCMLAVLTRFNLAAFKPPLIVASWDIRMCENERAKFLPAVHPAEFGHLEAIPYVDKYLHGYPWESARDMFLARFNELYQEEEVACN